MRTSLGFVKGCPLSPLSKSLTPRNNWVISRLSRRLPPRTPSPKKPAFESIEYDIKHRMGR